MRSLAAILTFLTVVLGIYLVMHGYVLARLAGWLSIRRGVWFWLVVIVLVGSLPGAMALERHFENQFTAAIRFLTLQWFGVIWIALWCVLLMEIIRPLLHLPNPTAARLAIFATAVLVIFAAVHARKLHTRVLTVDAPVRMDIAHLSDIHLGSVSPDTLADIIARTNQLRPDVVIITGDLIDSSSPKILDQLLQLDKFDAPVFVSFGNHEKYVGEEAVTQALAGTHVHVLRNEKRFFQGVFLIGLDDSNRASFVTQQLDELHVDPRRFNVLLFHRPTGLDEAAAAGVNLVLSGHTHRGQIFPFTLFIRLMFPDDQPVVTRNGTTMNVSSGTGLWGPRMRLGTTREITLIRLRSETREQHNNP